MPALDEQIADLEAEIADHIEAEAIGAKQRPPAHRDSREADGICHAQRLKAALSCLKELLDRRDELLRLRNRPL